jgi:uncharacterized protein
MDSCRRLRTLWAKGTAGRFVDLLAAVEPGYISGMAEIIGCIERIARYPVKSAGPEEVSNVALTPRGIRGDREYMVVRAVPEDNVYRFVTQRDRRSDDDVPQGFSALALVRPTLTGDGLVLRWKGESGSHFVPFFTEGAELPVRVWDDIVKAPDMGREPAQWLSDHLGARVRLVRAAGSFERKARQDYEESENDINFPDGYPVHAISRASLDELEERAQCMIPWTTFRPNIVIEGSEPRIEHVVRTGSMAGVPFTNPKPCDRCTTTNVVQETGDVVPNRVTQHLARYMRWRSRDGTPKLIFGTNLNPKGYGVISVGDEIIMAERRDPPLTYR